MKRRDFVGWIASCIAALPFLRRLTPAARKTVLVAEGDSIAPGYYDSTTDYRADGVHLIDTGFTDRAGFEAERARLNAWMRDHYDELHEAITEEAPVLRAVSRGRSPTVDGRPVKAWHSREIAPGVHFMDASTVEYWDDDDDDA